jgi:Carbohydrate-selective porin, OprB family
MLRPYSFCSLIWLFVCQTVVAQTVPTDLPTAPFTSVNQISDVQPTDWAYAALRSLSERHGCGLDRNPFQGNQALTRFEFATTLNLCLERIPSIQGVSQPDFAILTQLQSEFATELRSQRQRLDRLETTTATLTQQQFSPLVKLRGQVIAAVNAGGFAGDQIIAPQGAIVLRNQPNPTILYRASLDLDTSFTGRDLLKTRLVTGSDSIGDNVGGALEPNLGSTLDFSIPGRNNQISLGRLYYTFPAREDLRITVGALMVAPDFVDKNRYANTSFLDFSTQALVNNFVLFPRPAGAGAAIEWSPQNSAFRVRAVYIAGSGNNRIPENQPVLGGGAGDVRLFPNGGGGATGGLFGDPYQGVIELEYAPTQSLTMRAQVGGGRIFGSQFQVVGANAELAITQQIGVFGRYGTASYLDTTVGDLTPQYWMAGIGFRDLLIPKSIGGIAIGQPLIEDRIGNGTQTNLELFYNIPLSDRIRVTPLLQIITNPANQTANGAIFSGTLRTVFSF